MKSAIVTGAGAGLGEAIARRLSDDGFHVCIWDRNGAAAARVASDLANATSAAIDVTDEAAVARAVSEMPDAPRALVNNAGVVRFGMLAELSAADFRAVLDINLTGAFIVARACAARMMAAGGGAIVNITSINAITPGPGAGAYPASKAGLAQLTRHMALEWGPKGVRVNAVAPGFIDAGMSKPIYENQTARAKRGGGVPLRRLGEAADVAAAVSYLVSDAASYVNGHELVVDGGVAMSVLAALPRE